MMQSKKNFGVFSVVSIIIIAFVVYGSSLSNGFLMEWDDAWMVFNDYTRNFSWQNYANILAEYNRGQYSPLNQMIYTLIYRIWGGNAFAFHMMSLVLHAGCALLVWSVVQCFVNQRIAWGVAVLFLIHPLQVESVAWISASKILVYSFFYLLALRLYIEYVKKSKSWFYWLALFCFVLSFGGKEQAVTLPVCLLLFDAILGRSFNDWQLWKEKIPFFVLAFFFAYVTLLSHASKGGGLLMGMQVYPFYQRIAFGAYAYIEYIIKTFLPINLLYLYPFPMKMGAALPYRFWFYPIGLTLIFFIGYKFFRRPPVLWGLAYYTILIALTLQIIPMARAAIVADRYIYLAIPGLFFIMMYYADKYIQKAGKWKNVFIGVLLFYFFVLGFYSHHRAYAWSSNRALKGKLWELLEQREKMYIYDQDNSRK